ncbi:transcriptional repressor [Bacteroidia bacterium]|nr:transcriptional repressor [Bacteroidia bacterium]
MESNTIHKLHQHGITPSVQRIAIFEYLQEHFTHPTADTIYLALQKSIPTLSKTTVYNTLRLLAQQGAIQEISIDEKELHFDGDTTPHAHFQCLHCNAIFDLPIDIPLLATMIQDDRFTIIGTQIYCKGYCSCCKQTIGDTIFDTPQHYESNALLNN